MLLRKLLRDMRKNILSTLTIVLISALGIMFWAGFEGVTENTERIVEEYYLAHFMPDVFITGQGLTQGDIHDLEMNGASMIEGRTTFDMTAKDLEDATLRIFAQKLPCVLSRPLIVQGSDEASDDPRNIMLGHDFMQANGLSVGDDIRLLYENRYYEYHIIASIKTPETIYFLKDASSLFPNHKEFGFAILDEAAITDMVYGGRRHIYNQIVLKTDNPKAMQEYAVQKLGSRIVSVTDRSGQISASMVEQQEKESGAINGVFPTIFFIIAALISYTGMKRQVDKERITIGTMKALGVKGGAILLHYGSFGFVSSIFSALLGIPLGIVIPRLMLKVYELYFSFPPYTVIINYRISILASLLVCAMCTLSSFWAGKSTLSLSPSICMRPKSTRPGKRILLERWICLWEKFGFLQKIILRNMFRNKDRLVMSVFGISCSCALVFIAFGMQSSIDNMMSSTFEKLNSYELKVYFKPTATEPEKKRIVGLSEIAIGELVMETGAKITGKSGVQKTSSITVLPDISTLSGIYEGRDATAPLPMVGCMISSVLAENLGVTVGDDIAIEFTGKRKVITLSVNKIVVLSFGQGIYVSQSAWRQAGEPFIAGAALLRLDENADKDFLYEKINDYDFVLSAKVQSSLMEDMMQNMQASRTSILVMIIFAGLMAFIVLFNLGMMNFLEREREIATLKVVGFFSGEVKQMAFGENYIFTAFGTLFGLLLGNIGLDYMLALSVNEYYTFTKSVTAITYLYSFCMIFLFAISTNLFLGRYTKRADMLSALQSTQ